MHGNIRSYTNDELIKNSDPNSPHLIENGARAVDLRVIGVNNKTFDNSLKNTDFLPENTRRNYPDKHTHIALPKKPEFNLNNYLLTPPQEKGGCP